MRNQFDKTAEKIVSMREVTVTMHYAVHDHEDIISPNTLSFPSITDTIDKGTCEGLRELWRHAISKQKAAEPESSDASPLQRVMNVIERSLRGQMLENFVKAAIYPVPSEYMVLLPVRSNMRTEIISSLIPFERTREMLLNLEDKLVSPMRLLQIGHAPVDSFTKLKASMKQPDGLEKLFN